MKSEEIIRMIKKYLRIFMRRSPTKNEINDLYYRLTSKYAYENIHSLEDYLYISCRNFAADKIKEQKGY